MKNLDQNQYVFVLGREREIALEELKAVLDRCDFDYHIDSVTGNIAVINISSADTLTPALSLQGRGRKKDSLAPFGGERVRVRGVDENVAKLTSVLGGTVKIFKLLDCHCEESATTVSLVAPKERSGKQSLKILDPRIKSEDDREEGSPRSSERPRDDEMVELISDLIRARRAGISGKLNFGISCYTKGYSERTINTLGIEVKKALKSNFHARFVGLRQGLELSSIVSLKNSLVDRGIEIGLFNLGHLGGERGANTSEVGLGYLIALSNAEEWSKRDYGKPAGDKYSGMLPPKLARMMINIALVLRARNPKSDLRQAQIALSSTPRSLRLEESSSRMGESRNPKQNSNDQNYKSPNIRSSSPPKVGGVGGGMSLDHSTFDIASDLDIRALDFQGCLVVDPFCGSGNILMEALMLGCDVVGSDVSEKAVNDTKVNIAWLLDRMTKSKWFDYAHQSCQMSNRNPKVRIQKADATRSDFAKIFCHFEPLGGVKARNLQIHEVEDFSSRPACRTGRPEPRCRNDIIIVTEPYLGQPKKFRPSLNAVRGEYEKIKGLYLSFLSNLSCLSYLEGVTICIVFPLIETLEGERYSLYQNSVDEIKELGYTEVRQPLIYGREYQVVKREIVFLRLN